MANLSRAEFRHVTEFFPAVTEFFPSVTEPDGMAKSQPGQIPSPDGERSVTDGNDSVLDGAGRNHFRTDGIASGPFWLQNGARNEPKMGPKLSPKRGPKGGPEEHPKSPKPICFPCLFAHLASPKGDNSGITFGAISGSSFPAKAPPSIHFAMQFD